MSNLTPQHLATTVRILETGEYVAECHTCGWRSDAFLMRAMADSAAWEHEEDTRFGRTSA